MRRTGTFGPNLRRVRRARMTIDRLAERSGIPAFDLAAMEAGRVIPTEQGVFDLAKALKLDVVERANLLACRKETLRQATASPFMHAS